MAAATPEFRWAVFDRRGWEIPNRTGNPERAAHNLLERDRLFTDRLRTEIADLHLPAIEVDSAMSEDDLVSRVSAALRL